MDLWTVVALENMFYVNIEGKLIYGMNRDLTFVYLKTDGSITGYGLDYVLLIIFIPSKKLKKSEMLYCYVRVF